jgi:hypothetical protein
LQAQADAPVVGAPRCLGIYEQSGERRVVEVASVSRAARIIWSIF